MKAMIVVMMLALLGCASKEPQRVNDTRWSDYNHEIMMECGEVAGQLAGEDDPLADALYNRCVRDMNITI